VNKRRREKKMKNTLAKVISALMITTALFGFAAVLPLWADWPSWPQPDGQVPTVFVDPANNTFPPPAMGVDSIFTVNVTIANCSIIGGIGFTLSWDPTLLNAISGTGDVFFHDAGITPLAEQDPLSGNIWALKDKVNNTAGTYEYGYTYKDLTQAETYDPPYAPINITMANWPTEGKHGIAKIVFKVMKAPAINSYVNCSLALSNVLVGDVSTPLSKQIPTVDVDGVYKLVWSAPVISPYYSTEYTNYTALNVGDVFNVKVLVNNLDAGWQAVGFEFKLGYNSTLLQVLNVTEGPFLIPYNDTGNQGTVFMKNLFDDYVQVGDVVLPDEDGIWHAPFAHGTGVLAIIKFKAMMQGMYPTTLQCALPLYDTIVAMWFEATEITQLAPVGAWYSIAGKVTGRSIDIYTQWPAPYGGQGKDQPSDMFWPQKEICLYANVTYNQYPEQQKDVAFQIVDPHGHIWAILYARTDTNGVAKTCFRLPWPCREGEIYPEYYFGVWHVIGTVDIACVIVNDTLDFHYDYLINIFKVTVDKDAYNHTDWIGIVVEFGTHLQQTSVTYIDPDTGDTVTITNVTVAVTGLDNVHVPFGFVGVQVPLPGTVYCTYGNGSAQLSMLIPKFAAAGPGELDTAVLNNWPFSGGTVISGYLLDPITHTWLPYCPTPISITAYPYA
jgi:hypothetical protein